MKYSILVLGASISIALFIRICCSLEADLDQMEIDYLISGTADEVYEKFLRYSLLKGFRKGNNNNEEEEAVNKMGSTWMQEIKSTRNRIPSQKPPSKNKLRHTTLGINVDNELCGNSDPPDLSLECDDSSGGCSSDFTELPEGCEYNNLTNSMTCNTEQITNIPQLPSSQLDSLELKDTRIQNVLVDSFRNVNIKLIKLFENPIEYIHPWAFHDVKNLTTLLIRSNQITYLAYELYVGLDELTMIDLQNNHISFDIYRTCPVLPVEKIRSVLPNLLYMTLDENPLEVIPKRMFAGLRDSPVLALSLKNCYLKEIDEEAFTYLKNLEIINLSGNPSELVSAMGNLTKALKPLTSLRKIYLSQLGLSEFPIEVLSHIRHQLIYMDLSKNIFPTLKHSSLSQFPNLTELCLDECSIKTIERNAFSENTQLRILSLQNNNIQQLPSYFPLSLESLVLSNINLNPITQPVFFQNLTNLKNLNLLGFRLEKISTSTFVGLSALETLFIKWSNLQNIEDGSFKDLNNLKLLYLEDHPISHITPETFNGLDNLETLSMRNCSLSLSNSTFDGGSLFRFAPKLVDLNLINNNITNVSANMFQDSMCYIYLSDNPITSWYTSLFPDRRRVYDKADLNEDCFPVLHIDNGNIRYITNAMLEDFCRISEINLSGNNLLCNEKTCEFRDLIYSSLTTYKQQWINSENYQCFDSTKGFYITELTNDTCARFSGPETPDNPQSPTAATSSGVTTIISVIASLSVVTVVILILGYKNRAHLRYFWFSFKFNVMPVSVKPRKAKTSTTDDTSALCSFDYDVFISYHHDDAKFIQDIFLPEIELQEEQTQEPIFEARNTIYFIENDEIFKHNNNNNIKQKPSSTARFKVCLHERDFAAGVPITENIVDCVDRSRKTVIFISKKYMESQWCSYELNLAYHRQVESRRKSFVLVLMEEVPAEFRSKVLNYLMASKTYLQWPGVNGLVEEKEAFWKRLRGFLQSS